MAPLIIPLCPACALCENNFTLQIVFASAPVDASLHAAEPTPTSSAPVTLPPAPSPLAPEVLTYSVAEAAKVIGVGVPTVYRLIARRILKPIPGLRHKRLTKRQVQSYLNGAAP